MQTLAWEVLFQSIPEGQRNNLTIITRAGVEITVQCLLRIDPECVAIRGRLSGSQDAGRVFFIPYEQIDHVGFLREMKEVEFHEHFAGLSFPARTSSPASEVVVEPPPEEAPAGEDALALTPINPGTAPASRMNLPIKSEVLERFRSRSSPGRPGGT